MSKKIERFLIIAILIFLLLLLFEVSTRIFFWKLDTQTFHNIATPIITLLGFGGAIFTLLEIKKSSLATQSESYYKDSINQIEKYVMEGKMKKFGFDSLLLEPERQFDEKVNYLNFNILLEFCIKKIRNDSDYQSDLEEFRKDNNFMVKEITKRSYFKILYNLYTKILWPAEGFYDKISSFLLGILANKNLMDYHKEIIIKKLFTDVLLDYLTFCEKFTVNRHNLNIYVFEIIGIDISRKNDRTLINENNILKLFRFITTNKFISPFYHEFRDINV